MGIWGAWVCTLVNVSRSWESGSVRSNKTISISSSASVGLDQLSKVAEALEKFFKKAVDEGFVFAADVISLLSESVEACQKLLNQEEIAGHKELLDRLNNILQSCGA